MKALSSYYFGSQSRSAKSRVLALLLVLLIAAPQLLQAAVEPELPNPGTVAGYSRDQQVQIGQQAMGEVYKQMPVLPDSDPLTQYVQRLGRKLQTVIPQQDSWPYQFHVVLQKEINAFALPGGPIFINVGTITAADTEAQLVGVMAHEMSHVYMQHSVKQAKKESVPGAVAGILGGILGAYGGAVGSLAQLGIQIGAGAVFMKYSRQDESQADAVGAIIMYKVGYNPRAMAEFFQKLEEEGGSGGPQFLSDHPNPGNRYEAINKEVQNWPTKEWVVDSAQFQTARNEAGRVKAYTAQEISQGAKSGQWARQNQQGGAVPRSAPVSDSRQSSPKDNAAPATIGPMNVAVSNNYKTLRHQVFSIDYPDNWQLGGGGQSAVTIAPEGAVSDNAFAYGLLIDSFPARSSSMSQTTSDLISGIRQQNPDLRVVGEPQNIAVNGKPGQSVDMLSVSPVQENGKALQEQDWLVVLPAQNNSVLYLVFIAPERDFNRLRPTYEHMLRSFQLR